MNVLGWGCKTLWYNFMMLTKRWFGDTKAIYINTFKNSNLINIQRDSWCLNLAILKRQKIKSTRVSIIINILCSGE